MRRVKNSPLYDLAKTTRWVILYSRAKEITGLKLFENETDFSKIQIIYLQYLQMVNTLHLDLAMGEELMSEYVLQDELRAEAYLYYKSEQRKEEMKNMKNPQQQRNKRQVTGSIIFRRRINKKGE